MRIGIMGGSFDPIHLGHLQAAEDVLEKWQLDKVLFIPAGNPVLKQDRELAEPEHRYAMCVLACASNPQFEVSRIEIERKDLTYTIDTMRELSRLHPHAEFFFILGTDAMDSFAKWRDADEILRLCKLVEVPRSKFDISSTEIRTKLAQGWSARYFVHSDVYDYIHAKRLYISDLGRIKERLSLELGRQRMMHSVKVMEEAGKLVRHHNLGEKILQKALVAGLLHDCAKNICEESSLEDIKRLCELGGYELDEFLLDAPHLGNCYAGATLARRSYGIEHQEIIDAIASHTFGRVGMTTLDKIIYLADFIEPLRPDGEGVKKARLLAYEDIDKAVIYVLQLKLERARAAGQSVNSQTFDTLKDLEAKNG